MTDKIIITYSVWKKYPRYIIYNIYKNTYNAAGIKTSKKLIYRTTCPPKYGVKDE